MLFHSLSRSMSLYPSVLVLDFSIFSATVLFPETGALSGAQRTARAGDRQGYISQGRQSRYYHSLTSRTYYYYNEKYSTLKSSTTGFARYNRVYANNGGKYYSQYFSFTGRQAFKTFRDGVHKEISVCKNFEANENGTYLGIFTCPLPFEPDHFAYCCGVSNAEYCCRFEDNTVNIIGAVTLSLFIICPLAFTLYALQRWCRKEARLQREIRRRWRVAIAKVMDNERNEACKLAFVNSMAIEETDVDSSVTTGSIPSLPSICSSSTSLRKPDTRRITDDTKTYGAIEHVMDNERKETFISAVEDNAANRETYGDGSVSTGSIPFLPPICSSPTYFRKSDTVMAIEDTKTYGAIKIVKDNEAKKSFIPEVHGSMATVVADGESSVSTESFPSLPSIWSSSSSVRETDGV